MCGCVLLAFHYVPSGTFGDFPRGALLRTALLGTSPPRVLVRRSTCFPGCEPRGRRGAADRGRRSASLGQTGRLAGARPSSRLPPGGTWQLLLHTRSMTRLAPSYRDLLVSLFSWFCVAGVPSRWPSELYPVLRGGGSNQSS